MDKLVDKRGRVAYNEEDDIIFLYDVDLDSKIEEKEVWYLFFLVFTYLSRYYKLLCDKSS